MILGDISDAMLTGDACQFCADPMEGGDGNPQTCASCRHETLRAPNPNILRRAEVSECGRYRYSLDRMWDIRRPGVAFVMLNPSTADDKVDDPTIRRIVDFAQRWNFGSAYVFNLYAYRATDPKALRPLTYEERFGPGNTWALHRALNDFPVTVAAWGSNRMDEVPIALKSWDRPLMCLGMTKGGEPKHPLYLPKDTPLIPWSPWASSMPKRGSQSIQQGGRTMNSQVGRTCPPVSGLGQRNGPRGKTAFAKLEILASALRDIGDNVPCTSQAGFCAHCHAYSALELAALPVSLNANPSVGDRE